MAYDSTQGLYYNFFINSKERDFNPSYLSDLRILHSIFNLFPSGTFTLTNLQNNLFQEGLGNIKNTLKIDMGTSADDENMDTFKDMILEKHQLANAKTNMDSSFIINFTHKNKPDLTTDKEAKGWENASSSDVIDKIVSAYFQDKNIEATYTKGNWLRPNNQTEADFLHILKNRSLPTQSTLSKMFMWIDLNGVFNFQSLDNMLSKKPIDAIDFTDSDVDVLFPTNLDYVNNGIRYSVEDTNESFVEYEFTKTGNGGLTNLIKPAIKNIDGIDAVSSEAQLLATDKTKQNILQGYGHNLLSTDYNKALYINSIYDFPLRFSFTIKNRKNIKPGEIIYIIFPHNDKQKTYDLELSGKYLVTGVRKREEGLHYINDIYVASNSIREPIKAA